jgi:dolichyl-phosphate-mannose-protein mannosyltransferase
VGDAKQAQAQEGEAHVSGAPEVPANQKLLRTEERIEYRDQDGNLLNEEQVKALEGKVEFKTRYETRTRVIDADGNEILLPPGAEVPQEQEQAAAGVAPPHPDVEGKSSFAFRFSRPIWESGLLTRMLAGVDRETAKNVVPDEQIAEPKQSVEGEKEAEEKVAKPASEKKEASAKVDEL